MEGERKPLAIVRGNPRATDGQVRPGGDLVACMSNESGEWQVYLTRFPSGEVRWQVSVAGGEWPRWNATGDRTRPPSVTVIHNWYSEFKGKE